MFELLRPDKKMVGQRIRMIKEELGVSLSELGKRLGLNKSTINSYVQGYTLAPVEVIEQLAKIIDKSIGWFYFGEIEEYIREYLMKKGYEKLLLDYPDIPIKLKEEFVNSKDWDWKNEFGYPCEESLDDVFADVYHDIMKEYLSTLTKKYVESHYNLDGKQKEDAISLISADLYGEFADLGDIIYGEKEAIEHRIQIFYKHNIKDKTISFNDDYLVGKLINILGDDMETAKLISNLSQTLTNMNGFNAQFDGQVVIDAFQSLRQPLIKIYSENGRDRFYEWFEK